MNWKNNLKADPLPWLLEESEPGVRYLAMRDILVLAENDPALIAARQTAHKQGPIALILEEMHPDGYWIEPGPGYNPKYRSLVWSLILLASLGARIKEDARIQKAIDYYLEHALAPGGQFASATAPGGTADCLQGNLCWALTVLGSTDARLESALRLDGTHGDRGGHRTPGRQDHRSAVLCRKMRTGFRLWSE